MAIYHGKGTRIMLTPPVDACAQAKCQYCGLYGALGRCNGCGAANQPIELARPSFVLEGLPRTGSKLGWERR